MAWAAAGVKGEFGVQVVDRAAHSIAVDISAGAQRGELIRGPVLRVQMSDELLELVAIDKVKPGSPAGW